MPSNQAYNGQNATALVTPSRSRDAVGGRATLPTFHHKPIPDLSAFDQCQFWELVDIDMYDTDACFLWRGAVGKADGYARWREFYAHRIAYTLARGAITDGLTVDHVCRHKLCMNPSHLELVTPGENVRRRARGPSIGPKALPRKRSAKRYNRRRDRGVCIQCNTPSVKYRCDRCREIHNARNKGRKR